MDNSDLHSQKELFALISDGDEKAFERLYDQVKPKMAGYIIKLLKSEEAVKEVLQESMVRFWLSRDKLPEVQYPLSWLFKIVANESFRYLRRHGLQQSHLTEFTKTTSDVSNNTELEISYRETQRIIREVVSGLPDRQREVYRLSREEGLNMHEIAERMHLSFRYVKKILMATLKTIREKLIKAGRYTLPMLILLLF